MKPREDKSKDLKYDLQRQQIIFTVATKKNEAAIHARFIIGYLK
jgi:hypothetical protein